MKYILTIDTEKGAVSANLVRPIFLRTGDESLMVLECRKRIFGEYKNATTPDWLLDEVASIQRKLESEVAEVCRDSRHTSATGTVRNDSLHTIHRQPRNLNNLPVKKDGTIRYILARRAGSPKIGHRISRLPAVQGWDD